MVMRNTEMYTVAQFSPETEMCCLWFQNFFKFSNIFCI